MKAPKHVIDELDRWAENENNEFCIGSLLDDISSANWNFGESEGFSRETAQWVYKNLRTSNEDLPYELAVIEHVFGEWRLEVEDDK